MTQKKVLVKNNTTNYEIGINNCAPCQNKENKKNNKFKSCYSKQSLIKIVNAWNKENKKEKQIVIKSNTSKKKIWDSIQEKLNSACKKDEYCWKKQEFIKRLKDVDIELYSFKPNYPKQWITNKYTWLNTYDIYYVLKQYEKMYDDFAFLGPVPADCPTSINCELSKLDLMGMKKNKINKIGIVYNLDVSSGPGSHWTGLFIDNKNNEINYYDSYGSKPTPLIDKFIQKISEEYLKNNIQPTIIYNDKRHQYGGSECGVYSMNFILERIHGTTMYQISNMEIPDEKMNYLRKLLYNTQT